MPKAKQLSSPPSLCDGERGCLLLELYAFELKLAGLGRELSKGHPKEMCFLLWWGYQVGLLWSLEYQNPSGHQTAVSTCPHTGTKANGKGRVFQMTNVAPVIVLANGKVRLNVHMVSFQVFHP